MKKMGKVTRVVALLTLTLLFGLFLIGSGNNLNKVQAATTLNNPRIVADSSMKAGQKVTWDCVWFGAYPQSEVTSGNIYNSLRDKRPLTRACLKNKSCTKHIFPRPFS